MMKKQGYMKYMRSKAMTLYILAALLVSFPHMAMAMALPFNATANGTSTYLDSSGGTVTLNVQAEQTDGPNGVVILTASSQGVSEFSSQNYEKRCFLTIDGPFPEDMQPMPQAGGGKSYAAAGTHAAGNACAFGNALIVSS